MSQVKEIPPLPRDFINERSLNSDTEPTSKVQVGDVVILKNEGTTRQFWKLGIVTELLPSKDQEIRSVKVRVVTGKDQTIILKRSVTHLVPVEIKSNIFDANVSKETLDNSKRMIKVPRTI